MSHSGKKRKPIAPLEEPSSKRKKKHDPDAWILQLQALIEDIQNTSDNNPLSVSPVSYPSVPDTEIQSFLPQQKRIFLDCVKQRSKRCILGCAGSGKTYLEAKIVQELRHCQHSSSIAVLVPTGMASGGIEGSEVIHAFLGLPEKLLPPTNTNVRKACNHILKRRPLLEGRIRLLRTLVIDEISMVTAQLLDFLSEVLSILSHNDSSFGGLQVLAVGDPYQLPPVLVQRPGESQQQYDQRVRDSFFFKSEHFQNVFPLESIEELDTSVRQKEDSPFVELLNRLKQGKLTNADYDLLDSRNVECMNANEKLIMYDKNNMMDHLYCTNKKVDERNRSELHQVLANLDKQCEYEPKIAIATTKPWKPNYIKYYKLRLKQYNKYQKLMKNDVNGHYASRNKSFVAKHITEFGHMEKSKKTASMELTMQVFKKTVSDEHAYFYPGVAVMLTRNLNVSKGLYHGKVGIIVGLCELTQHPLVRWNDDLAKQPLPDPYRVERYTWSVAFCEGTLRYEHYPLVYAWATTVHKYQGRTAHNGIVADLSDVFVCGQAYSLVSRVKRLSGLVLVGNLPRDCKLCHPDVLAFVERIHSEKQKKLMTHKQKYSGSLLQKQRILARNLALNPR